MPSPPINPQAGFAGNAQNLLSAYRHYLPTLTSISIPHFQREPPEILPIPHCGLHKPQDPFRDIISEFSSPTPHFLLHQHLACSPPPLQHPRAPQECFSKHLRPLADPARLLLQRPAPLKLQELGSQARPPTHLRHQPLCVRAGDGGGVNYDRSACAAAARQVVVEDETRPAEGGVDGEFGVVDTGPVDAAGDAVERGDHEGGVANEDDGEEGVHEGGGEDGGVWGKGGVGRVGGAVGIGDGRVGSLGGREVWWEDGGIRDFENGLFDQRDFALQGVRSAESVGDSRLALAATSQLSGATFSLLVRCQGVVIPFATAIKAKCHVCACLPRPRSYVPVFASCHRPSGT